MYNIVLNISCRFLHSLKDRQLLCKRLRGNQLVKWEVGDQFKFSSNICHYVRVLFF